MFIENMMGARNNIKKIILSSKDEPWILGIAPREKKKKKNARLHKTLKTLGGS